MSMVAHYGTPGGLSPLLEQRLSPARDDAAHRAGDDAAHRAGERGFTMMELLVVLAIMGLLIVAMPAIVAAGRPGVDARSTAIAIADDLRAARITAVATDHEAQLVFDIAAGSYAIEPGGRRRDLPPGTVVHFRGSRGEVTADTAAIRFFPDGTSTGAELLLDHGGQEHRVRANWLTGRISVDE
jgi:general secretion pathway protein H